MRLRIILSISSCIYSPGWCESESVAGRGLHGPPSIFWCPPWPGWPVLCATQLDWGEGHLCWLYWLFICCLGTRLWLLFRNGVDRWVIFCILKICINLLYIFIILHTHARFLKCLCSLMFWFCGNDWHSFIVISSLLVWTEHIVFWHYSHSSLLAYSTLPFKVNL